MANQDDVTVGVGGDNRRLKSALSESRRLVSQFAGLGKSALGPFNRVLKNSFDSVFSLKGAVATLAGTGGLGLLVTSSIRAADEIGKTASRIGVGVEAYQELTFAARESGVEVGLFSTALTALVRRSGEAISGNKGFAQAFADIGITVEDLRSLRPEDLLGRVADGVKDLGSQSQQIAALDRVMSEAGRRMFNFTNLGSDGIARLRQEARDLGVVLDSVMVREAERAGDQLGRVGNILRTNLTRAVLSLTPQLIALAEGFTQHLQPAVQWLIQHLPDTAVASDELTRRLGGLRQEIQSLAGMSLQDLLALPDFTGFDQETRTVLANLLKDYKRLGDLLLERKRKEALVEEAINGSSGASETGAAKIREVAEAIQFEIDQLGRSQVQQDLYTEAKKAGVEVHGAFAAAIEPLLNKLAKEKAAMDSATESAKKLKDAQAELLRRAAAIFEETRTPFEAYQEQLAELNELLEAGAIDQETYNRAVRNAQDEFDKAADKTDLLTEGQEELGRVVKRVGDSALRGSMDTWKDWADVALDAIGNVLQAYLDSQNKMQGGGGIFGGIFGGGGGGGGSSGIVAGDDPLGTIFNLGSLFSGFGFADGGNPPVGKASVVGEEGPELFVPKAAGTVIPAGQTAAMLNGNAGGGAGGPFYYIDARGSTDPAETERSVQRALTRAIPGIVRASTEAVAERHMREPRYLDSTRRS